MGIVRLGALQAIELHQQTSNQQQTINNNQAAGTPEHENIHQALGVV
jgi:hypothetical protein